MRKLDVEFNDYGPHRVVGPVFRLVELPVGAQGPHGPITEFTPDWARLNYERVAEKATMLNPRQSGHEIEGRVRIGGKTYSAFTSAGETEVGGVRYDGMIIVRDWSETSGRSKKSRFGSHKKTHTRG